MFSQICYNLNQILAFGSENQARPVLHFLPILLLSIQGKVSSAEWLPNLSFVTSWIQSHAGHIDGMFQYNPHSLMGYLLMLTVQVSLFGISLSKTHENG